MKRRMIVLIAVFLITSLLTSSGFAGEENFPVTPKTKNGVKWRIGYCEGGAYTNYPKNLRALILAFSEIGWIEKIVLPPQEGIETAKLWQWICSNVKSEYIQLVADAYWSSDFNKDLRHKNKKAMIDRLKKKKDIDLMLAMGTWAGQDLANNDHSTSTIVMSSSNPIQSKIIKSVEDSGFDHVNARVDPTRYERQIRIFHDIFKFKKLGITYEQNTSEGRSYAAIDDVKKIAKELDFKIITCNAPWANTSIEELKAGVLKCHNELASKVDAFYVTTHGGVKPQNFAALMKPLYDNKVPVFSQLGSRDVRYGALMSIARAGFKYIALYHAQTIAKIFNGAKPRDIQQLFEDPPKIAINLEVAEIIKYDPPIDILSSADEIYQEIEKAK